jgi:N-acyl-phosphatidylethanolamine-hydrolysing phospholipase D
MIRTLLIVFLFSACAAQSNAPEPSTMSKSTTTTRKITRLELIPAAQKDEHGRYQNLDREASHGSLWTRLAFFGRRITTPFRSSKGAAPVYPSPQPEAFGMNSVRWVGHSTLLVSMEGMNFLTDPIWSNTPSPLPPLGPSRFVSPGLTIKQLPDIDFVLISHNHYDHLDIPSLIKLNQQFPNTRFLVPTDNAALLKKHNINNVLELNWGEQIQLGTLTITGLPAQHWSKRGIGDTRQALWSSWAVSSESKQFYFGGDSAYFSGYSLIGTTLGPFDLVALPIGAYQPRAMMASSHMNPEEAIQAATDLNASKILPIHYGTFDLSDEPLDEPLARFEAALQDPSINVSPVILQIGEHRAF